MSSIFMNIKLYKIINKHITNKFTITEIEKKQYNNRDK